MYILTNSSLPGMVKIGMTTGSPHARAVQLSTTGVPDSFKVFGFVKVSDPRDVEQRMHKKLFKQRVSNKREFFKINPQFALDVLETVSGESEVMRREKAIRLEKENQERIEKEKKNAHETKMRNEWTLYFNILDKRSGRGALIKISEYIGNAGWAMFWVALAFFYFKKKDTGLIVFGISLAVGSISLFFDKLATNERERLRSVANSMMVRKHGSNWDSF